MLSDLNILRCILKKREGELYDLGHHSANNEKYIRNGVLLNLFDISSDMLLF